MIFVTQLGIFRQKEDFQTQESYRQSASGNKFESLLFIYVYDHNLLKLQLKIWKSELEKPSCETGWGDLQPPSAHHPHSSIGIRQWSLVMIILVPNTAGSGNLVMIIHNIYFGHKGFKGSKLLNSEGVRLSSSSIHNLQSSVFNLEMQKIIDLSGFLNRMGRRRKSWR